MIHPFFSQMARTAILTAGAGLLMLLASCSLTPPEASCMDRIKNYAEEDIDCGGGCPACPNCTDNLRNGDETGADCGGSQCLPCGTAPCSPASGMLRISRKDGTIQTLPIVPGSGSLESGPYLWFSVPGPDPKTTCECHLVNHWLPFPSTNEFRFPIKEGIHSSDNEAYMHGGLFINGFWYAAVAQSGLLILQYRNYDVDVYSCGMKFAREKDTVEASFKLSY